MNKASTSSDDQIVFFYVKKFFPDAINRYQFMDNNGNQCEADIFIPEINTVIEYDGAYFHKDKYDRDVLKTEIFNNSGLYVVHIRETGLEELPPYNGLQVWHKIGRGKNIIGMHTNEYITAIFNDLSKLCKAPQKKKDLENYNLTYDEFKLNLPTINALFLDSPVERSASAYWEMKYWDYEKNGTLNPENVPYDANIKVYLKCPSGESKHVNVSMVCCLDTRREKEFDGPLTRICPLVVPTPDMCDDPRSFLSKSSFICCEPCEYFYSRLEQFVNDYLDGKEEYEIDEKIKRDLIDYLAYSEDVLLNIIKRGLYESAIETRFRKLMLNESQSGLCNSLRQIKIPDTESLKVYVQLQKKYDLHDIVFDAMAFDTDENKRNYLIGYLKWYFSLDKFGRAFYLTQIFGRAISKRNPVAMSEDLKGKLKVLIKEFKIEGLSVDLVDVIGLQ